ncbi:MAG: aminomethyl transferase family protein [Desulfobacteraceae bacterium]|nr:aminomethyl transferase family protein [Desulfobacteraceae bacterium]
MNTTLKTTPLNQWHRNAGANMADFGGFDMPLWYETGVKTEHLSVLTSAGIFDTSHMACITVTGKDSFSLLNYCFTRDLASLVAGRCIYGAFLNEKGHSIDDAIIYKFNDSDFMVCVNAGMGGTIAGHLQANKNELETEISDLTAKVAKMDIQGKNAARILSKVIKDPEHVFSKMPYFSFKGSFDDNLPCIEQVRLLDDTPVLLSRSGYTGEFGFEIFLSPDAIVKLWEDILEAGKDVGITACGLGARDSLRAGACLPLSHQDVGDWIFLNHPWDFALPYNQDRSGFTKDFIGRDALLNNSNGTYIYPFAGENLRKVPAGKETQVLDTNEKAVGHVLTCATDMGISWHDNAIVSIATKGLSQDIKIKGVSCGFVMVTQQLDPGCKLVLKEGRRAIKATIVSDIRPDRTARKKLSNFI